MSTRTCTMSVLWINAPQLCTGAHALCNGFSMAANGPEETHITNTEGSSQIKP